MQEKDDVVQALAEAILLNNETVSNSDWDIVSILGSYKQNVLRLHGYLYKDGNKTADVTFDRNTIGLIVNRLRNLMSVELKNQWHACVFNIREPDLKLASAFEHDDESRWLPSSGKELGSQVHAACLLLE